LGSHRKASASLYFATKAEQQASNRVAPPEHAEVERKKPERGLTLELSGHINREAIDWSA